MGGVGAGRRGEPALRPVEYRVPDRLREPTAFELFEGAERLLKRTLNELSLNGRGETALAQDIRGYLGLTERGRPAIEHARRLVDEDTSKKMKEADHARKTKEPHHRKAG